MNHRCHLLWLFAFIPMGGCSPDRADYSQFAHARLRSTHWDTAFTAALETMETFFHIERVDRNAGTIQSAPTEIRQRDAQVGLGLSTPKPLRHIAELVIEPGDGDLVARCRVWIQQGDSSGRLYRLGRGTGDEIPNQTPLEETQGRGYQSHQTWSTIRQDRAMERKILAALAERLARLENEQTP